MADQTSRRKAVTKQLVTSTDNHSSNGAVLFLIVPSICLVVLAVVTVCIENLINPNDQTVFERINLEPVINKEFLQESHNRKRLWSSNVNKDHIVIQPRLTSSKLVFGISWSNDTATDWSPVYEKWLISDGKSFGQYMIISNDTELIISFITDVQVGLGDTWTVRFTIKPLQAQPIPLSLITYVYNEMGPLGFSGNHALQIIEEIYGYTNEIQDFRLYFPHRISSNDTIHRYAINYLSTVSDIPASAHNFSTSTENANQYINFVTCKEENNVSQLFERDIVYESGIYSAAMSVSGSQFAVLLSSKAMEFDKRFEETFHLSFKGFDSDHIYVAKEALSNVLGRLSYTHNTIRIKSVDGSPDVTEYFPASLFGVISNDTFSFSVNCYCLLLIIHWDMDIAKDIVGSWFDLISLDGWIPNEWSNNKLKILNHESIYVHPPVAFFALEHLINKMELTNSLDKWFLQRLFPRVQAWFDWLYYTQKGTVEGSFRWQNIEDMDYGQQYVYSLNDIPRSSHFSSEERHVDLRCWMAQGIRVLVRMSGLIDENSDQLALVHESLRDVKKLDNLHWDDKHKVYADFGLNSNSIKFSKVKSTIQAAKKIKLKFVNSVGYTNFFPLFFKLLPLDSPKLGYLLKYLNDDTQLWSKYGLKSFSNRSNQHIFIDSNNIWNGHVHISMNYLALQSLKYYSNSNGPYSSIAEKLYSNLRNAIVHTVINSYHKTNQFWPYYDASTGDGKGNPKDSLITSLIVLIMAEK